MATLHAITSAVPCPLLTHAPLGKVWPVRFKALRAAKWHPHEHASMLFARELPENRVHEFRYLAARFGAHLAVVARLYIVGRMPSVRRIWYFFEFFLFHSFISP